MLRYCIPETVLQSLLKEPSAAYWRTTSKLMEVSGFLKFWFLTWAEKPLLKLKNKSAKAYTKTAYRDII